MTHDARLVKPGARKGTHLLTPNQEYTWDVFQACKTNDANLTHLKVDGGFSFNTGEAIHSANQIKDCMTKHGFTF